MKGNYALQVSKIKSHAKRMTYNRREYPRYVRMIKAHDLYRKEMRTPQGGVPTEHKKIRHRRHCARAGCIFKSLYKTRQQPYYSTLSDIACIICASISSHSSGLSFSSVFVASRP